MNFGEYVIYIFNFAVAVAGILAVVVIMYNGAKLVVSRDNVAQRGEVKRKIINALIGLAIILLSFLLLKTINPSLVDTSNISLGNITFTLPSLSTTTTTTVGSYQFEEIPIGTLVESILAGTSSTRNQLPCYEYEHNAEDGDGNLIIANTVDRNGDGNIDSRDTLLDKDVFYCIKLLDDAIKEKTEVHLNKLINELDTLMHQCGCSRCHSGHFPIASEPDDCVAENEIPGFIYPQTRPCPYCIKAKSFCHSCGSAHVGCQEDPQDTYDTGFAASYNGFEQYGHDPCPNRLEIDCKRQEIKQLIDGTQPDAVCYQEVNGTSFLKRAPDNLFTIKQGLDRLEAFRQYYESQVSKLKSAEEKMKPADLEKITLAEYYALENTSSYSSISKSSSDSSVDNSRYCSDFNFSSGYVVGKSIVYTKGKLTADKRICKKNSENKDYYFYEGDPATFYYNNQYNKDKTPEEGTEDSCAVSEGKLSKNEYQGIIPIGETVDGTEAYGAEVSHRIGKIKEEVQGIIDTGISIYQMPNSCDCSNCQSGNARSGQYACYKPCCSRGGCGNCYCAPFKCLSCLTAEPTENKKNADGTDKMKTINDRCMPYSSCTGGTGTKDVTEAQDDWWVCPYNTFCSYMKALYQTKAIDDSCYKDTSDATEAALRSTNLSKVGYVQKFKEREARLFELAAVDVIEDDEDYDDVATTDLISSICPEYLRQPDNTALSCNDGASTDAAVENRFTLLQKLTISRQRLLGCVTGYGVSYKEGDSIKKARVFSCQEGINYLALKSLTILPNFPYPSTGGNYWNCYPLNSSTLSAEEKAACLTNKDKETTDSNGPGCQQVIKEYMDNYYCCE